MQSVPVACAGLTLINMVWFWYVANAYRYKDVKHAQKRYVGGTALKPPRGPVPPWARAREVTIPAGHRRAVSAPLPPQQSSPAASLWLAMLTLPTGVGPAWAVSAAACSVVCSLQMC